jgi:hypothetical protein
MTRTQTTLAVIAAFLLGVAAALAVVQLKQNQSSPQSALRKLQKLSAEQIGGLTLYAKLRDGLLEGSFFNQNAEIQVKQITVEAVPKDETNPFNKLSPRLFNVITVAAPRSMSPAFRVETGLLNPEFHSLRVVEAEGVPAP